MIKATTSLEYVAPLAHEIADAAINWGGYAEDSEGSDERSGRREDLSAAILRLVRLEELRAVLRSESMSYGELAELQGLAPHIADGDVELLEAAGVPESEA